MQNIKMEKHFAPTLVHSSRVRFPLHPDWIEKIYIFFLYSRSPAYVSIILSPLRPYKHLDIRLDIFEKYIGQAQILDSFSSNIGEMV